MPTDHTFPKQLDSLFFFFFFYLDLVFDVNIVYDVYLFFYILFYYYLKKKSLFKSSSQNKLLEISLNELVIYKAFCCYGAQSRMNGAPS